MANDFLAGHNGISIIRQSDDGELALFSTIDEATKTWLNALHYIWGLCTYDIINYISVFTTRLDYQFCFFQGRKARVSRKHWRIISKLLRIPTSVLYESWLIPMIFHSRKQNLPSLSQVWLIFMIVTRFYTNISHTEYIVHRNKWSLLYSKNILKSWFINLIFYVLISFSCVILNFRNITFSTEITFQSMCFPNFLFNFHTKWFNFPLIRINFELGILLKLFFEPWKPENVLEFYTRTLN